METPNQKEERYNIKEKNIKFFSPKKLINLFLALLLAFFTAFGLLFFIDIMIYPELGVMELAMKARAKRDIWMEAKSTDLAHEAIAFENMLDAYALQGGDISHSLDTLTDEFTAANWAELLEYDVDYFLKHGEVNDSIKSNGMLHVVKILYSSGHYDLFKQGYKILINEFSKPEDLPVIYSELIRLQAGFSYDDEEERVELQTLYDLELRRHLRLTAAGIVSALEEDKLSSGNLLTFINSLNDAFNGENVLNQKSQKFKNQVETDLVQIIALTREKARADGNQELLEASGKLAAYLSSQGMTSASSLAA